MFNKGLILIVLGGLIVFSSALYWQFYAGNQKYLQSINKEAEQKIIPENIIPLPPENKELRLLFVGDIMVDRHVKNLISKEGVSYLFSPLDKSFFTGYDLISANLEGAVTRNGEHYSPAGENDFAFSPQTVVEFKDYNFNFFNLANNHLTDQGQAGVEETRQNLKELGFNYSGCQDGKVGDCSYTVVEINSTKIALFGFSQVYQALDNDLIKETINKLSTTTDFQIVNIHWGNEYEHEYNAKQQDLAHLMIDAGADVIIGHHPHVVQGMEIYNNKPIFYSLGNFIFDQYFSQDTQEELAIEINLLPDSKELTLWPLKSKNSQLSLLTGEEKINFLTKYISWSPGMEDYAEEIKEGIIRVK